MIYLANPYSDPDMNVVERRYRAVRKTFARLTNEGYIVFSPILMAHDAAIEHGLPTDAAYWSRHNTAFLRRCQSLYVLKLPGWESSTGLRFELKLAQELLLPIVYLED